MTYLRTKPRAPPGTSRAILSIMRAASVFSYVRTFHRLQMLRLWTPTVLYIHRQAKTMIYYMSHQYCNKSKSQLTSPTPAQLPAVAVSTGHIVYRILNQDMHMYCQMSGCNNMGELLSPWAMSPTRQFFSF
jgi:hypothetical protein